MAMTCIPPTVPSNYFKRSIKTSFNNIQLNTIKFSNFFLLKGKVFSVHVIKTKGKRRYTSPYS